MTATADATFPERRSWLGERRRRLRRRWKHRPGLVPWLLARPTLGFLALLRLLPWSWVRVATAGLGRLAWWSRRRRANGRRQIGNAMPQASARQRDRILRSSCGQLGVAAAEILVAAGRYGLALAERADFEPGARDTLASLAGGPAVLVQAHLGSFEVFGGVAAQLGLRAAFPMRLPGNHYVAKELLRTRQGHGVQVIPRKGAVRRMLGHLRDGGSVILACDQNAHHAPIFVPWFGELAATERAPAALALRTGAPLVVCWCVRTGKDLRYRVGCEQVRPAGPPSRAEDADIEEATAAMHAVLEKVILQHPEQYLWIHNRYRTRPPHSA